MERKHYTTIAFWLASVTVFFYSVAATGVLLQPHNEDQICMNSYWKISWNQTQSVCDKLDLTRKMEREHYMTIASVTEFFYSVAATGVLLQPHNEVKIGMKLY